eukprot:6210657-Pleurochrysis_carterae.AAC.1
MQNEFHAKPHLREQHCGNLAWRCLGDICAIYSTNASLTRVVAGTATTAATATTSSAVSAVSAISATATIAAATACAPTAVRAPAQLSPQRCGKHRRRWIVPEHLCREKRRRADRERLRQMNAKPGGGEGAKARGEEVVLSTNAAKRRQQRARARV